jgi:proteasome accessory factor C
MSGSRRRRPRPAEERLRRLLVMLPWLMERGSVPVDEVAERFDLEPDEVAADLELVSMCGLPPYVDELIDVFIEEGTVHVGVPRLFTRSLKLNSLEAFDLVAAGRAAMEMPGADPAGPLGRGLAKLEAVLAAELASTADPPASGDAAVTIDLERPEVADVVAEAARRIEWLQVTYWSASTDSVSERRIVPRQVFADRGNWYVVADDDRSGERRTFRLDRLESVTPTGEFADPVDDPLPAPGDWFADADVERATLRLDSSARWVVERYPVDEVTEADGVLTVTLPVVSRRWLEKVLIRLGPHAEVVAPAELSAIGQEAARRVLANYRRS